jgi:hypothetical protein
MKIFPRPFPPLRPRSAPNGSIVPVAAPADLRDLRLEGRHTRPRAAWTIDMASRRPVCLWDKQTEALGRAEDEDAQSRPRRALRSLARAMRRTPVPKASSKLHAAAL